MGARNEGVYFLCGPASGSYKKYTDGYISYRVRRCPTRHKTVSSYLPLDISYGVALRTPSAAEFPPCPLRNSLRRSGPWPPTRADNSGYARTARQSVVGSGKRVYNISARLPPFLIRVWHGANYQRGGRMRRYVVLVLLVLLALLLRGDSRP